jgi:hypothetical protein
MNQNYIDSGGLRFQTARFSHRLGAGVWIVLRERRVGKDAIRSIVADRSSIDFNSGVRGSGLRMPRKSLPEHSWPNLILLQPAN